MKKLYKSLLNNMKLIYATILSKITVQQLIVIIGAFLLPVQPLLLLVGLCILLDTIFGIIASYKEKIKITSHGLSHIISKFILYQGSVLLIFVLEKYLLCDFVNLFITIPLFLTKIVAIILVTIETVSIHENVERGFKINIWGKLKNILRRAKEVKAVADDVIADVKDTKEKINGLVDDKLKEGK